VHHPFPVVEVGAQLHHIPSLLINPSRRIRLAAVTLQSSFLQIQEVHDQLLFFLRETASSSQLENILGAFFLASNDVDRSVAAISSRVWEKIAVSISKNAAGSSSAKRISLNDTTRSLLTSFIQRAALDPNGVYTSFNPVAPAAPSLMGHSHQPKKGSVKGSQAPTPRRDDGGDETPRSKIDEQEESEQDRTARLRIGALGALKWLLGKISSPLVILPNIGPFRLFTLFVRRSEGYLFKSCFLDCTEPSRNARLGQFREFWVQSTERQEICLGFGSISTYIPW